MFLLFTSELIQVKGHLFVITLTVEKVLPEMKNLLDTKGKLLEGKKEENMFNLFYRMNLLTLVLLLLLLYVDVAPVFIIILLLLFRFFTCCLLPLLIG